MTKSAISNLELMPHEVNLHGLITLEPGGVFMRIVTGPDHDRLLQDVDTLFREGFLFSEVDYPMLMAVLFTTEYFEHRPLLSARVAKSLARFDPERQSLYREVMIEEDGSVAEYFFESIQTPQVLNQPIYSPDGGKKNQLLGYHEVTCLAPVQLEFDEFVAALWLKGVRFGLLEETIRKHLREQSTVRTEVARALNPTESFDAQVVEVCEKMHQDRSPFILANGRTDMRRAKNHFPHVSQGEVLLQKLPPVSGHFGYSVTGQPLAPRAPQDLDLALLCGSGTHITKNSKGEFLVAAMDGFITIDPHTETICLSASLENRTGVNIRSTGDLQIHVKEFKEHGEVQEGRVIEGQNMSFMASVYGTVIGRGGDLTLGSNISGGHALSKGGNIQIKGKAFNSLIEAREGNVVLHYAEDCTIIGESVTIEHAINCDVLSTRVNIILAEGCMVMGKHLDLATLGSTKFMDSVVFIVLPDTDEIDQQLKQEQSQWNDLQMLLSQKLQQIVRDNPDPLLQKYIRMQEALFKGTLTLSENDKKAVDVLTKKFASLLSPLALLQEKSQQSLQRLQNLEAERLACNSLEHCHIQTIRDHIKVELLHSNRGLGHFFQSMKRREIKTTLKNLALRGNPLFQADRGSYTWNYKSLWDTPPSK